MDIMQKFDNRPIGKDGRPVEPELPFHRRLWKAWVIVGHKIGVFNSRVILTLFYFLIITPYAWVMAFTSDPLKIKGRQTWVKRTTRDLTLDDARRQF